MAALIHNITHNKHSKSPENTLLEPKSKKRSNSWKTRNAKREHVLASKHAKHAFNSHNSARINTVGSQSIKRDN